MYLQLIDVNKFLTYNPTVYDRIDPGLIDSI